MSRVNCLEPDNNTDLQDVYSEEKKAGYSESADGLGLCYHLSRFSQDTYHWPPEKSPEVAAAMAPSVWGQASSEEFWRRCSC